MYAARQASRSEFVDANGLRLHVRRWGQPGAPRVFMLHGWMDCSATFQFLVDGFVHEWDVIAPDWRGFGLSEWQNSSYWFPDYLVDLECLLDHYSPDRPALIVGHSMGGNIAGIFAGLRPQRVARFVSLEALGSAIRDTADYLARTSQWVRDKRQGVPVHRTYASIERFAERLLQANPRLRPDRALFMATHFSRVDAQGRIVPAADPWHRMFSPFLMRSEEFSQAWADITAPVLWVVAEESDLLRRYDDRQDEYRARLGSFRDATEVRVREASHNLQHDQPETLAPLVEDFLRS